MSKKMIAYVVHSRSWNYNDEYYYVENTLPTKTFLSREKAEAYRKTLEPEARCFDNPFEVEGLSLEEWTSLSKAEFDAALRKLKLNPPEHDDYFSWWTDELGGRVSAKQRNGVYDLLDKVQFFEVVETEIELVE